MTLLETLIQIHKIMAHVSYIGRHDNPEFKDTVKWQIKLKFEKRVFTSDFYMGYALKDEPTISDLFKAILEDIETLSSSCCYSDWCKELGYDEFDRRTKSLYKKVEKQDTKFQKFLGEHFPAFMTAYRADCEKQ